MSLTSHDHGTLVPHCSVHMGFIWGSACNPRGPVTPTVWPVSGTPEHQLLQNPVDDSHSLRETHGEIGNQLFTVARLVTTQRLV